MDTRRYYDLTAEQTADTWYERDDLEPMLRELVELLPANPRILDLGCGPGHESKRLAALGAQVLGVDFSEQSIRVARERCPECRFEVVDFNELDGRWGTFDSVLACGSLIHTEPGELPAVLGRIAAVLGDDGRLLAVVRDGEGMREVESELDGEVLLRTVHYTTLSSFTTAAEPWFVHERSIVIDPPLSEHGWRAHLFRKKTGDFGQRWTNRI